ncbi:MAG: hypothetical protein CEE38_20985 [Planctomycetes bacterium B3_Pla]|nr:MAG: hypothetical protein CEE38_20985 [Planctomycetes bacterium B3_Pla]
MKVRLRRAIGIIVVLLGLSIAIIPRFVFPVCEAGSLGFMNSFQPTMRCYWFGRVEIILGSLVAFTGLIMLFLPKPDAGLVSGVILIGLGVAVIAVSTNAIIGSTCGHSHSLCQIGTKPAERIAGGLVILMGFGLVMSSRKGSMQP